MLSPSWIQRSEDFVGIVTPTRPPGADAEPAAGAWSAVFWAEPQAAADMVTAKARVAAVASRRNFIVLPSGSQALGEPVVGLVPADAVEERGRGGVGVDQEQLGAGHRREVVQGLGQDVAGEHRVVRAARGEPQL